MAVSEYRRAYVREQMRRRVQENMAGLRLIKESVPCADCGNFYPHYVMDFDHTDPSQKLFPLTSIGGRTWTAVAREVDKCDVVCSNCHREREHIRRKEAPNELR